MTDLSLEEFIACMYSFSDSGNKVAGVIHSILTTDCDKSLEGVSGLVAAACDQATKLAEELVNRSDTGFDNVPDLESYHRQTLDDKRTRPPQHSSLLHQAGVVSQLWPGTIGGISTRPNVLVSMLALGMLGGGLGYATGRAADAAQETDNRKRRLGMTAAGALLGAAPAAAAGAIRMHGGESLRDVLLGQKTAAGFSYAGQNMVVPSKITGIAWNDPYVSQKLPQEVRVVITVSMEGARRVSNPYRPAIGVTAGDLGMVGLSAGGGYLGGFAAGKMLGALFNVSPETQRTLRRTGMFAGVIRKAVPLIFGN